MRDVTYHLVECEKCGYRRPEWMTGPHKRSYGAGWSFYDEKYAPRCDGEFHPVEQSAKAAS